jgi:hypothetical protein
MSRYGCLLGLKVKEIKQKYRISDWDIGKLINKPPQTINVSINYTPFRPTRFVRRDSVETAEKIAKALSELTGIPWRDFIWYPGKPEEDAPNLPPVQKGKKNKLFPAVPRS